jgi:hypothetical protein
MRQTLHGFPQRGIYPRLDIGAPGIGTAFTGNYGLFLTNNSPALSGLQQYSPPLVFTAGGFSTTPSASRRMDIKVYAIGAQAANASGVLNFDIFLNSVNQGTYLQIDSTNGILANSSIQCAAASSFRWQARCRMLSGADGIITFVNSAITDFTRFNLGGTTSSFPGIGRNGIFLEFLAADGAATASTALYNTKTSTTNFERLTNEWNANVCRLWTEKGSGGGTARDFVLGADATEVLRLTSADLKMATAKTLSIASGSNQRCGDAVLVAGTVTVSNTTVTANTRVFLTRKSTGGTIGFAITYTLIAATSFTITSDNALDTSTYSYLLVEVP